MCRRMRTSFPIGKARIVREGDDVTVVGIGYTTYIAQQAAEALADDGISAEVVDLLSTSPMDEQTILESVQRTRKVVIVDEDYPRCSIASDISALVAGAGVRLPRRSARASQPALIRPSRTAVHWKRCTCPPPKRSSTP